MSKNATFFYDGVNRKKSFDASEQRYEIKNRLRSISQIRDIDSEEEIEEDEIENFEKMGNRRR